jgi:DNA invertase Pin-like site-specific DNA recombinase
MLPADIILRKSRAGDESLDDVFHVHRPRLIALAEEHKLKYTIAEDVVSGAKAADMDAIFGKVMQKTEQGGSRVWVCMDVDRLARPDMEQMGRILKCVQRHQVYILTPGRIYDPNNLDDLADIKLKLFFADWELHSYKRRTAITRDHITRKECRYSSGSVPFGYVWNKNLKRYETDPLNYPLAAYAWSLIGHYGHNTVYRIVKEKFGDPVITRF